MEFFIPARLKVLLAEKKVMGLPSPSHRDAAETWVWPGKMRSWWISSAITRTRCRRQQSSMAASSSRVQTRPTGLWGLQRRKKSGFSFRMVSSKAAMSTV